MIRISSYIIFFLTLTLSLSAQTLAQKYDFIKDDFLSKTYLGVNVGFGIPFNEFSSTNINTSTSGYAKTGFTYNFIFRYAFTPSFGTTLKFLNSSNSFDAQTYQNNMNQYYSKYNSSASFTSDPYQINGFMIGPTFILPSPKMNFETSIYIGDLTGTLPANSISFSPPLPVSFNTSQGIVNTKVSSLTQSVYTANNFAVSFDIAFRYLVSKNLILSASADVVFCDLTFKSIQQLLTDTAGNIYAGSLPNYSQPFRLVHLNIGIGFQLDN